MIHMKGGEKKKDLIYKTLLALPFANKDHILP